MTCKIDENKHISPVQTNRKHIPSSPRSNSQCSKRRQLAQGARNRAGQLIEVQPPERWSDHRKQHKRTNSQSSKRHQLAHGARNRAGQLIALQEPAKSTTTQLSIQTNTNNPHRLTVIEATTAGSRCSESCRSVNYWTSTCKVDEKNQNLSFQITKNTSPIVASVPTHSTPSDDSWPTLLGIVPFS